MAKNRLFCSHTGLARRTTSSSMDLLLFLLCNPFAANHKQWVNKPARRFTMLNLTFLYNIGPWSVRAKLGQGPSQQMGPVVKELNTNGLILVIPVFHIRGVGHTGGFTIISPTVQLAEMSLLCSRSVKVEGQACAHCLATCTAFSGGANIFIHEYMPFKSFSTVAKGPKQAPFC